MDLTFHFVRYKEQKLYNVSDIWLSLGFFYIHLIILLKHFAVYVVFWEDLKSTYKRDSVKNTE